MDYVVGSVAALISGNVTPSRPKLIKRALTPTKHQPSPNVTPKSEFVEDRSIFLSPTQQKKKAIIKKSPKRIFQNPDLDTTADGDCNASVTSPKADKVKKHLKQELDADDMNKMKSIDQKSPNNKLNKISDNSFSPSVDGTQSETTPRKKKNKRNAESMENNSLSENVKKERHHITESNPKSPDKKTQRSTSKAYLSHIQDADSKGAMISESFAVLNNSKTCVEDTIEKPKLEDIENQPNKKKKKHKKNKKVIQTEESEVNPSNLNSNENKLDQDATITEKLNKSKTKKKNKKNKNKQSKHNITEAFAEVITQETEKTDVEEIDKMESQSDSENDVVHWKDVPNPNAITEKDSDSEHDSDNEIESENDETNEKLLNNETDKQDESSDEEEKVKKEKIINENEEKKTEVMTAEEIKRTLFVGNVPFSSKCKKQIKKIFAKYGQIETVRIRTIPVKDARMTPKLAVIKNELHPERTTVNVYVKYTEPASVGKAIAANNMLLEGNHLRVSRSDTTGSDHDPRCAVFVGNLPFAIEDETLRSKFEKCGEIDSVRIIRDRKTNAGKGFGYVNFTSKDGVELALSLSEEDLTIKNRILRVNRCTHGQSKGQRAGGGQAPRGGTWGAPQDPAREGAARRLMYKRKQQEGVSGDGPPNKVQKNITQPAKEKKPRKEFVGMTAEKKKKKKFDKGQKKRKALSEILTKKP